MADISLGSSASAVSARPELSSHNGIVTTTSVQVAQFFGKRHDNVLRAIRVLLREGSSADYLLNFEEVILDFTNGKGGVQSGTAYQMTREGFMLLAMGFTELRNRFFHYSNGNQANITAAEIVDSDYFFSLINERCLHYISKIFHSVVVLTMPVHDPSV